VCVCINKIILENLAAQPNAIKMPANQRKHGIALNLCMFDFVIQDVMLDLHHLAMLLDTEIFRILATLPLERAKQYMSRRIVRSSKSKSRKAS
jgi:hypothetical protein